MQIKRLLWTLLAETVAYLVIVLVSVIFIFLLFQILEDMSPAKPMAVKVRLESDWKPTAKEFLESQPAGFVKIKRLKLLNEELNKLSDEDLLEFVRTKKLSVSGLNKPVAFTVIQTPHPRETFLRRGFLTFQVILLFTLFIAWIVTIYRNLSAPKG